MDPFAELLDKLRASRVFLLLMPPAEAGGLDMKVCVELGAAMFLDMPIWVLCPVGRSIPANVKLVAAETITLTGDKERDGKAVADLMMKEPN